MKMMMTTTTRHKENNNNNNDDDNDDDYEDDNDNNDTVDDHESLVLECLQPTQCAATLSLTHTPTWQRSNHANPVWHRVR